MREFRCATFENRLHGGNIGHHGGNENWLTFSLLRFSTLGFFFLHTCIFTSFFQCCKLAPTLVLRAQNSTLIHFHLSIHQSRAIESQNEPLTQGKGCLVENLWVCGIGADLLHLATKSSCTWSPSHRWNKTTYGLSTLMNSFIIQWRQVSHLG